jgi:hypothetical protein
VLHLIHVHLGVLLCHGLRGLLVEVFVVLHDVAHVGLRNGLTSVLALDALLGLLTTLHEHALEVLFVVHVALIGELLLLHVLL